jgi:hypothetical protein
VAERGRVGAALGALLLVAGCATSWSAIRRTAPTVTGTFDMSAVALGECVERAFLGHTDPRGPLHELKFETEDEPGTLVVRGGYPNRELDAIEYPALEVRFVQTVPLVVTVEVRLASSSPAAMGAAAWRIVRCCAENASAIPCGGRRRPAP